MPTSVAVVALVLTVLAIAIGAVLGLRWGGSLDNGLQWRPPLWQALVGGVVVLALVDLVGLRGWFAAFIVLVATAAVLAFTVVNVRIGGMVLLVAGVGLNFLVTLINWGMPVRANALVSANIVEKGDLPNVLLSGGRSISGGAVLGFLGDVIPLPWGQVISFGDILILVGVCLVTANVLRAYQVGGGRRGYGGRRGTQDYSIAMEALGRGPAPRRGPGLHPSRMNQRGPQRRPPQGRPQPGPQRGGPGRGRGSRLR